MDDDFDLLRDYAATGSHAAFDAIVKRHSGWVYATARRRTGSADLADDVTQATFIVLARKAKQVGRRESLAAWLYRVARYAAVDALRRRGTRLRHERQAAKPEALVAEDASLDPIAPHLDAALDRLPARDREAVVLHFFDGRTLQQIGDQQHVAASTVQRRLEKSLSKLGLDLKRRGVAPASTAALATSIAAVATLVAPPSATAGMTAPATAAGPVGLAKGVAHTMTIMKLKLAAAVVAGAVTLGVGGVAITQVVGQSNARRAGIAPAKPAAAAVMPPAPSQQTGVDFARQFEANWASTNLSVTHVNAAVADPDRGQRDQQSLTVNLEVTVKDPTNVVGLDRMARLRVTRATDDAGRDVTGLVAAAPDTDRWYMPLQYGQVFDDGLKQFVSRLDKQRAQFNLTADGRLPARLASVEGTLDVLTCERVEQIDVPFKTGQAFTQILPGQRVRFTTAEQNGDSYSYTLAGSEERPGTPPFNGQIDERRPLPERMVVDRYFVDAAGKPLENYRPPMGLFPSAAGGESGSGSGRRNVPAAAMRFVVAVGLKQQQLPVTLTSIELPVLNTAEKVLPKPLAAATSPVTPIDRMAYAIDRQFEARRKLPDSTAWDSAKEAKIEAQWKAFVADHDAGVVPMRARAIDGITPDAVGYESYVGTYWVRPQVTVEVVEGGVQRPPVAPPPPEPVTVRKDSAGRFWVDLKDESMPAAARDGGLFGVPSGAQIVPTDPADPKSPPQLMGLWILRSGGKTAAYPVPGNPKMAGIEMSREGPKK